MLHINFNHYMAKIDHLLPQAAEIRDAMQEGENTALRIGTMFVDLIQALEEVLASDDETREAALKAIRQSIASEASTRAAGDGRLESMCNSLRDDFGTEASERANADNELQASIALLRSSLDNLKESAGSDIDSIYEQLRSLRDHIEDSLSELRPVEVESEEAMAGLIASGEIDDNRMYYVPESGLS